MAEDAVNAESSGTEDGVVEPGGVITPVAVSMGESLVARLGSADAALDALLLSLNKGYSTPQVRDAVSDSSLQADGSIAGAQPSLMALNMILMPEEEGESDALETDEVPETLSYAQDALLPIEVLRERARKNAGVASANELEVGRGGVTFLLVLLNAGFASDDIVEMMIFGVDGFATSSGIMGSGAGRFGAELPEGCSPAFLVVDEFICPNGSRVGVGTNDEQDEEAVPEEPDDSSDAPEPDTDEATALILQGSFGDFPFLADFEGRPLDAILENQISVDQSGDVPVIGGIYRYLAPSDNYADSPDVVCEFEGIIELIQAPLDDAVLDGTVWTGTVTLVGSQADGTCPTGQIDVTGLEGMGTLTLTISSSGFEGLLDLNGLTWAIVGQPGN